MTGGVGVLFFAVAVCLFIPAMIIDVCWIESSTVQVVKPESDGVILRGVAPEFVAAVVEERARHRVSDPDRRAKGGDIREDYDDEPV